jgi:hypothetical protein
MCSGFPRAFEFHALTNYSAPRQTPNTLTPHIRAEDKEAIAAAARMLLCMKSVEITGGGKPPHVVAHSAGNCATDAPA